MKRSSVALLVVGLLGYGALALLFPRLSPVAGWRYEMDRRTATAAAQAVAGRLGVDVRGWPSSVAVLSAEEPTSYLRSTKLDPAIEALLTPLQTHVLFSEPARREAFLEQVPRARKVTSARRMLAEMTQGYGQALSLARFPLP